MAVKFFLEALLATSEYEYLIFILKTTLAELGYNPATTREGQSAGIAGETKNTIDHYHIVHILLCISLLEFRHLSRAAFFLSCPPSSPDAAAAAVQSNTLVTPSVLAPSL